MATIIDNPNTLGGGTTVTSYLSPKQYFLVELRRLLVGTNVYFWTRVVVKVATNSPIKAVCSTGGLTVEEGYVSGDNNTPGSVFCSKAICFSGYPTQMSSFSGSYGYRPGTFDDIPLVAFTSY